MVSYSKEMTIGEYQNNFLEDEKYREYCKKIYQRLSTPEYKSENGVKKQTMCFVMALLFKGTSNAKDGCGNLFASKVANFNSFSSWQRQAGSFYRLGKDGELDFSKEEREKYSQLDINKKLKDVIEWFFNESKINIQKNNKNELMESSKKMLDILVGNMKMVDIQYIKEINVLSLLLSNKQLIMNGAPGTGKTFSARNEIADGLFGIESANNSNKENIKQIQMDMVQFHPSYDYTDFIEGIRPNLSGENVGYTLKNGSFKRFCRRAGVIERILAAGMSVEENSIEIFLNGEDEEIVSFWKNYIKNKKDIEVEKLPRFLFIIDEINRAEISKVLGETMFCLDADYRGIKGKIATQYASLATDETFYINKDNDKFFIPSNVYIIGTMNDIDRSVEVFDFALRRRFAWHEITANAVMDKVLRSMEVDKKLGGEYTDYLDKINAVNTAINDTLKLNRHYHLGPSYFAKIALYLNGDYKSAREEVWNNHISQILNEYVKGKRTETEIEKIGKNFMS